LNSCRITYNARKINKATNFFKTDGIYLIRTFGVWGSLFGVGFYIDLNNPEQRTLNDKQKTK